MRRQRLGPWSLSGPALPAVLAFEFLVLTAARRGEVRDAEWAEIDPAGRV